MIAALTLAGCDGDKIKKAQALAAAQLKDPNSAQFRNVRTKNIFVCGEINGKNSFGAYNGFARFYATDSSASIDPQDNNEMVRGVDGSSPSAIFNQSWSAYCG